MTPRLSDKIASFSYTRSSLSFFSVRRAKGATHENWWAPDHAHCWRRETGEASRAAGLVSRVSRLCCSTLARACNPLTKSEDKREHEAVRSLILHDSIFSQFPRELSTKKTKPNIEKWPKSLGVMLEFWRSIRSVGCCSQRMNIKKNKKKYAKKGFCSNSLYCKILTVKQSIFFHLPLTTASSVIM